MTLPRIGAKNLPRSKINLQKGITKIFLHQFLGLLRVNKTGVSAHMSQLSDPSRGVSLDEDPVRQSTGSKDGAKSVEQDEATPKSPNEHQGSSFSSQMATANATTNKKRKRFGVSLFC